MDYLAEHQQMLQLAASGQIPSRITAATGLSVSVCRELDEAGLLCATRAHTMDGFAFLNPRITVAGREYLNELEQRAAEASPVGKAKRIGYLAAGWIGGILTAVIVALILARLGLTGT